MLFPLEQRGSLSMAKRRTPMSEKETLKHYTPCEETPPAPAHGAGIQKMLDDIRASKPTFIKAVLAIDPVLTGRRSAVIKSPVSRSKKKRERRHAKKDE
jgi:hypothetical protein